MTLRTTGRQWIGLIGVGFASAVGLAAVLFVFFRIIVHSCAC